MAYRVSELSELFKLVLQECLEKCACQLDDDLFDRNVALLLDQVKKIGNEYGSKMDETTTFQIITAAKNANKRQKYTFEEDKMCTLYRYQGRTTNLWNLGLNGGYGIGIFPKSSYNFLSVKDEEEINSHMLRELSSFVGNQDRLKYRNRGGFEQQILKQSQHLTIENLVKNGILNNSEIYLDNWELRSKNYSYIEDRFLLDPIIIKGYAHDPTLAQSVPGSKWKNGSLSIYYKWNEKEPTNAEFSFFIPSRTKICFLFDLEFKIKISFKSSLASNLLSLGISHLFDLAVNENRECSNWTYPRKLEFTIITTSRRLRCLEKIDLHVSQNTAADFLQMEALLINLKYKLKNHDVEEIKRLKNCQAAREALKEDGMDINQEIDVMIEFLKMLDAKDSEIKQNFDYETAEAFAFSSFSYLQLIDYLAALKHNQGGREALIKIIQLKPKIVEECPTFAELISQNSQNENMFLGIAFEDLMSTEIIATARKNDFLLTLYEGDGFGILPNGNNTPQYSDLVFCDEKGNYHSYQMKFSDTKEKINEMVREFFTKHQQKENLTQIDELSLDNTKILVPEGFADEITLDNGTKIKTLDEINLNDKIKIKMATVEELKEFLQKNYKALQTLKKTELVQNLRELEKNIKYLEKQLNKKINDLQRDTNSNEYNEITNEKIVELRDELNRANDLLEECQENLANNHFYRPDIKQILKQCATICLVASVCSGVSYFVIHLHKNWDDYKSGKITGWELSKKVASNTAKGAIHSSAISLFIFGGTEIAKYMLTSPNSLVNSSGSILANALGPGFMSISIIFQTMNIIIGSNDTSERNKLLTRMGISSSVGLIAAKVSSVLFTGPIGICITAGSCIAIALGDFFLGDKIASLFFKEDADEIESILRQKFEEIDIEVTKKAYSLFCLTEHCTDRELKHAYQAAALKFHPDKCQKDKKEENKKIFQAVSAAYSYLNEKRKK